LQQARLQSIIRSIPQSTIAFGVSGFAKDGTTLYKILSGPFDPRHGCAFVRDADLDDSEALLGHLR
jgi:hypothetical protein